MRVRILAGLIAAVLVGCGTGADDAGDGAADAPDAPDSAEVLRLYTTVTQDTVDAVVDAWAEESDVEIEVFRAPTAEFNARVAAERREDRIRADVFWLTDPPSMLAFEADGLLHSFEPEEAAALPESMRTDTYWGTRVLNLVIAHQADHTPAPTGWQDLAEPEFVDEVGVFDPGFAGSGLAALGYFAFADEFGTEFFQALADNGAVQRQAPGEVLTGVAEGAFSAGMVLDKLLRDAIADGSPVELVWPEPGAIQVTSPIAVLADAEARDAAEEFVNFVLTPQAQEAIAGTGWQPARDDVEWEHQTEPVVEPDYEATFLQREELLADWRSAFGG